MVKKERKLATSSEAGEAGHRTEALHSTCVMSAAVEGWGPGEAAPAGPRGSLLGLAPPSPTGAAGVLF